MLGLDVHRREGAAARRRRAPEKRHGAAGPLGKTAEPSRRLPATDIGLVACGDRFRPRQRAIPIRALGSRPIRTRAAQGFGKREQTPLRLCTPTDFSRRARRLDIHTAKVTNVLAYNEISDAARRVACNASAPRTQHRHKNAGEGCADGDRAGDVPRIAVARAASGSGLVERRGLRHVSPGRRLWF